MNKMNNNINTALRELINLTDNKIKHLNDILDITSKQKEAIAEQDIDMLSKYVQQKQEHIDIINELDEKFQIIYESIRDKLQKDGSRHDTALSDEEAILYGEFRKKVRDAHYIVRTIFGLEKENNENTNKIMEDLKEKIRAINVGQKGYKAYKSSPTLTDGIYVDKKR